MVNMAVIFWPVFEPKYSFAAATIIGNTKRKSPDAPVLVAVVFQS